MIGLCRGTPTRPREAQNHESPCRVAPPPHRRCDWRRYRARLPPGGAPAHRGRAAVALIHREPERLPRFGTGVPGTREHDRHACQPMTIGSTDISNAPKRCRSRRVSSNWSASRSPCDEVERPRNGSWVAVVAKLGVRRRLNEVRPLVGDRTTAQPGSGAVRAAVIVATFLQCGWGVGGGLNATAAQAPRRIATISPREYQRGGTRAC